MAPRRPHKPGKRKREIQQEDVGKLQQSVDDYDPKSGEAKSFSDLPISKATAVGLEDSHFQVLTEIQAQAIPLALKGRDILGAAKTGSGKTLAFLVPLLEKLYRSQWTELDGLGALIISPTRELAVQIFEVLRKIGRYHTFSAGLVIGGKSLREEAERLARMNILVCTPGRMLQHLDQTAGIEVDDLQMLVLDEADRTLDMGFQSAVDALVAHLPRQRQTMLFSATQSKKVSDLARLSLKDAEYISVHEAAAAATPETLQQHYIVIPLAEKLDTLYGFIKANLKSKMIVFLSSGKQVRFFFESIRHLQPGIPLLELRGRKKQDGRLRITQKFTSAKHCCLFATDIVARGVDFPSVDWVIQVDCPEDADTYIHRVGRTARYQSNGRAILFLDPCEEEGFLKRLEHKKVPIQKVNVREKKKKSIQHELQTMCFQNPDLKYLGQTAFISYARSLHLQGDDEVFKFDEYDFDALATSFGLPGTPQIKFRKGEDAKKLKNAPRDGFSSDSEFDSDDPAPRRPKKPEVRTKYDRMFERTNQDVLSSHYSKMIEENGDQDENDFLTVKRVLKDEDLEDDGGGPDLKVVTGLGKEPLIIDSKRREKLLKSKKKLLKFRDQPTKLVFDDDGEGHAIYELQDEDDFREEGPVGEQINKFVETEAARVREADVEDKLLAKQKRKEKRDKRKAREALETDGVDGDADGPQLWAPDTNEDPLALLAELPIAGGGSDGEESFRARKKSRRVSPSHESRMPEPKSLEDLEALAAGLLAA